MGSFGTGKLQVLATAADENLGGRNFDLVLMKHFASYVLKKYKMDVLANPKATMKLRKECTRVKKCLSANKDVRFTVEYIMNDTDVQGQISRDEFAKKCSSLVERICTPLNEVLSIAKVKKSELHSLEIVGGAVRIPMVKAKLKEWFNGKNLSATCDGDESVARGCALQCAMLAPFVKVRDFEVNDITPYGIQLYWQPYKKDDTRSLAEIWSEDCTNSPVPARNPIPSKKIISFKDKTEPFQVIAKYTDDSKLPSDTEPFLGRWIISDIPKSKHPSNEGKPVKIKVKFQLDINGVFSVCHAQSIETYEIEIEEEVKVEIKPEEIVKENADNDPQKKEAAKSSTDGAAAAAAAAADNTSASTTAASPSDVSNADVDTPDNSNADDSKNPSKESTNKTASQASKSSNEASEEEASKKKDEKKKEPKEKERQKPKYRIDKVKKKKSKKDKIDLHIKEQFIVQLSDKIIEHCRKEELNMMKLDNEVRETNELRNSLEGYVLEMRGKLEGSLGPYMQDDARQSFIKELNAMEDWLYDDGYDAEKIAFEERLKNLKLTGDPVARRSTEAKRRPECIKLLNRTIAEGKALAETKDKKYEHISKEEREKAIKICKDAENWLTGQLKKQDPLSLADDPVVLCETIEQKAKESREKYTKIMNKPKPKPKKEKKPKTETKDKDQEKKNKSADEKMTDVENDENKNNDEKTQSDPMEDDPLMDLGCD